MQQNDCARHALARCSPSKVPGLRYDVQGHALPQAADQPQSGWISSPRFGWQRRQWRGGSGGNGATRLEARNRPLARPGWLSGRPVGTVLGVMRGLLPRHAVHAPFASEFFRVSRWDAPLLPRARRDVAQNV